MKATIFAAIAATLAATSANAQSARQPNPCATLTAEQCKAETHCRYQPAQTIIYSVAGKEHTRERAARCAIGIKMTAAKVATKN
ncbi:MAG: hypothetical protein IT536_04430 [Hyphomicrobiales bacterium]|nr:hypothetical protein [Hyphomicrobiales bacterium]